MNEKTQSAKVVSTFCNLSKAERQMAGGKGGTLAYLYQCGYPVPDGLVILPSGFVDDELSDVPWTQVKISLEHLRQTGENVSFAVRSSALSEDSVRASFAGQFETVLDVLSDDQILSAIQTVRQSRLSERVRAYSQARGIPVIQDMAVVVQKMVHADISGVLFTANPVDGSRTKMVGNFVHGLGEKLVGGEIQATSFTIKRLKYEYHGPVETERFARRLYKLATRLERDLGSPQDIEWAVKGNKVYILQSRPITALLGWDTVTGESNDSLTGDYAWSSVNVGEATAVVMTPLTWSIIRASYDQLKIVPGYSLVGNIGGRAYLNSTVLAHMLIAMHMNVKEQAREAGGVPEEAMEIFLKTLTPLPGASRLNIIFNALKSAIKQKNALRHLSRFVVENPAWCRSVYSCFNAMPSIDGLSSVYRQVLEPRLLKSFLGVWVSATRNMAYTGRLRHELIELIGPSDADTLLSGVSQQDELLASLGPVVGLSRLARGEITREAYLEQWGHRFEAECEFYFPRPLENPEWLDMKLAEFSKYPVDVDAMLAARKEEFDAAWDRFQKRYPGQAKSMRRQLDRAAEYARMREAVRSEFLRLAWVIRTWILRVASLTGIGDDVFFLTRDELMESLSGKKINMAYLPARRYTYVRYKDLPCYPVAIFGRFNPFKWATDPKRRNDMFDSSGRYYDLVDASLRGNVIIGMPGAAGSVEGFVRRLYSPDEGDRLQRGEILVTSLTNIGWTPIFPRVGAIVTDIGAPLSHAAIVARELGIPAVVNCRDASSRLHTGDKVRVDGTRGIIEILKTEVISSS
jgi:phosphohistidine swiveling domain-containing protein